MTENEQTNGAAAPKKPATVVESVTMTDGSGRVVEFAGKRKLQKETILAEDGSLAYVQFDFRNGETRSWSPPPSIIGRLAGHGAEQKVGDETAGEDDVDDMVLAVDAIIERLNRGEWTIKREGGMGGTSVLIKALVEYSKNSVEKIQAYLKDKTQAEKLGLRNSPQLKPIVERLEAEKAAKAAHIDTDALLAKLPVAEEQVAAA